MTKLINKPWGHELWISDGTTMPYALKRILFNAGRQTSLQVHKFKFETNYVLSGNGTLLISEEFFDVGKYINGEMSEGDIANHINSMKPLKLSSGTIFHVTPGHLHRVIANTDLIFMEASSPELDDVIRLKDDTDRPDGRVDSEHK